MNRTLLIFSLIILMFNELFAQKQNPVESSYSVISKQIENELLDKATKEIEHKKYEESIKHFYSPAAFDSTNSIYNYETALSLYSNFQQLKSIPYFERALRHSKDTIQEAYYFLGNSYHLSGNYNKAEQNYKIYLSLLEKHSSLMPKGEMADAKNDISHRIEMCENGKRLSASSSGRCPLLKEGKKIMISTIGNNINTLFDDFGPVFSANDSILFFTSKQTDEGNIYFSRFENNKWTTAESIGWPINTGSYEAVLNVSPDGKRIYFYRAGIHDGTVYYSDFQNHHWNFPKPLLTENEAKTTFKETSIFSFALNTAKDELFVISDRVGGLGGKDIYVSKKMIDSTWGPLENLGAPINTSYDEVALSLSTDGNTMYFSSNGNNSIGGFDVFVSNRKGGKWSQPLNLGVPINTPGDDLFFSFLHNSNRASYSSSAYAGNSNRDLDIYYVDFCEEVTENTIMGLAIGFTKGTITVSEADAKSDISRCIIKDGKYSMNLKVGKRYNFIFETEGIQLVKAEYTVPEAKECKRYDIYQELSFKKPGDTLRIKSAILDIAYEKSNPDITSYSALLNKEDKTKLKNYSESNWFTYPPEPLKITTVVYDTTSGKELSKVTFDNTLFDSEKGKIKEKYDRELAKASASAAIKADITISSNNRLLDSDKSESETKEKQGNETVKAKNELGSKDVTTFSFSDILFDFDKSKIKEKNKADLDKAVEFIKQVKPDSKIVVAGYTDSKGHRKHNQALSKRRAEAVARYLMSKKINKNKITIVGYGENKPLVPNKNADGTDNREGRAKNRRTEIVIK